MFDTCEMRELVFVYGSLKVGFYNHSVMKAAGGTFVECAVTDEAIYSMADMGAYPAVIEGGKHYILGEVYDVVDISVLDGLEGHPFLYERKQIRFKGLGLVWVYLYVDAHHIDLSRLVGEEWRRFHQEGRQEGVYEYP